MWYDQEKWVWSQSNSILIFFWLIVYIIVKLLLATDPVEISQLVPKIRAVEGLQKQLETKKISALFSYIVKILLDQITCI